MCTINYPLHYYYEKTVKRRSIMAKSFKDLTKDELIEETRMMVDGQFRHLYKSISRLNNLIELEDCVQYLVDRMNIDKLKSREKLYVWSKHRLYDLYRKTSNDVHIIDSFGSWYSFIIDNFPKINEREIVAILLSINAKFKNFMKVDEFLTGKNGKINYYKIKKEYSAIIKKNKLKCSPTRDSITKFFKDEKSKYFNVEKFITVEYKEYEDYNEYDLLDNETNLEDCRYDYY